ncbi:MAG: hypothetical protein WD049_00545 [Candidatus Paceibacterota bacterium]
MKTYGTLALFAFLFVGCAPPATEQPAAPDVSDHSKPDGTTDTDTISILAWNVESGGNDPEVIAEQLKELSDYDVYCLSEVSPSSLGQYLNALSPEVLAVNSETGRGDRLQIIFDSNRFELLQQNELHEYQDHELNNGNHRSPLFVRLRDRETDTEFIVMTNHLARGNADFRKQQAIGLREWARDQNVGVVNIGDFNMDYDFASEQGNEAFVEMLRDNVWNWVKPEQLIDTNWSDPDGDGMDNYPDSMLDFGFVAGPAKDWNPVCNVIVREGDFPDDETTSDHRPIELFISP